MQSCHALQVWFRLDEVGALQTEHADYISEPTLASLNNGGLEVEIQLFSFEFRSKELEELLQWPYITGSRSNHYSTADIIRRPRGGEKNCIDRDGITSARVV